LICVLFCCAAGVVVGGGGERGVVVVVSVVHGLAARFLALVEDVHVGGWERGLVVWFLLLWFGLRIMYIHLPSHSYAGNRCGRGPTSTSERSRTAAGGEPRGKRLQPGS